MDKELREYLEAMEARMMRRINDGQERILAQLVDLRSEHSVTRNMVTALPGTILGAIEKPLLNRISATEARITALEKEKPE
jgi:hypothetical protein